MSYRVIAVALLALFANGVCADEEITFTYDYTLDHRADFSKIRSGQLRVAQFTDARDVESPNVIAPGYRADKPLADIVRDALVQGFVKGKATLADEGGNLLLEGNIVATQLDTVTNNGVESLQLTVRTQVKLQGSGRTMFQTVLFGRGVVPVSDGIGKALEAALGRTVRELVQDDYFLNEII